MSSLATPLPKATAPDTQTKNNLNVFRWHIYNVYLWRLCHRQLLKFDGIFILLRGPQVGAGMGALGIDGVRRGEYISKRAVFEGIVADPALDGGVVACCVVGGNGVGGRRGGGTNISGGSDDVGGALGGFDVGRSESRQGSGSQGAAPVPTEKGRSLTVSDRTTINNISINRNNHDGDGEGRDKICPEAPQVSSGSSGSGNKIAKKKTKNNSSDETRRARSRRKELLAAASVCATTGGTMAPVASLPRGSTAPAPGSGGRTMATSDADALRPGGEGDQRKSSIFVWPRKIEASSQEAGLEATVPFRLTCVRATAFEARFKGAHNALLAGTREGMALAFDWGRLLRNSGGGGCSGDRGWGNGKKEENGGEKAAALAPSAQVMWRGVADDRPKCGVFPCLRQHGTFFVHNPAPLLLFLFFESDVKMFAASLMYVQYHNRTSPCP